MFELRSALGTVGGLRKCILAPEGGAARIAEPHSPQVEQRDERHRRHCKEERFQRNAHRPREAKEQHSDDTEERRPYLAFQCSVLVEVEKARSDDPEHYPYTKEHRKNLIGITLWHEALL